MIIRAATAADSQAIRRVYQSAFPENEWEQVANLAIKALRQDHDKRIAHQRVFNQSFGTSGGPGGDACVQFVFLQLGNDFMAGAGEVTEIAPGQGAGEYAE